MQLTCDCSGEGRGVRLVIVGLDVGIRELEVQALRDRLDGELGGVREGVRQNVSGSNFDSLLEEIVLENDEPGIDDR